tara:strand:+ start:85 stop:918 length:834 start_codon:yes stop_codon:yes gene_type:complete
MMNIISLGAGVQSSTMALMGATGELDYKIDAAIFADTQAEPKEVYKFLDFLEKEISKSPYPFLIHKVSRGSLTKDSLKIYTKKRNNEKYAKLLIPAYITKRYDGSGILGRKCTADYKVVEVDKKIKQLMGYKKGQRIPKGIYANSLIGISIDEAHRMKPSRIPHKKNIYPLIEKNFTRGHCLEWMESHGYPKPPRSACIYCPFHSDKEWLNMKKNNPKDFNFAVKYEKELQKVATIDESMLGMPYLHNSCKPLDKVHFDVNKSLDLFGNECEGMCGV